MIIRTIVVTPFMQNARIIIDESAKTALIVDPGGDIKNILSALDPDSSGISITAIFLTHSHIDHAGGVSILLEQVLSSTGKTIPVWGHAGETALRKTISAQALMFGVSANEFRNCPEPDLYLNDEDVIPVGSINARVLFTPGHSPGHISLYFTEKTWDSQWMDETGRFVIESRQITAPLLIAGDALFAGSIGRTDLPGADHQTLLRSIREKLYTLPDETCVMCGHGEDTTIGREKRTNPFVRQ